MKKSAWLGVIVIAIGVILFVGHLPVGWRVLRADWVWPIIWIVFGIFGASNSRHSRWPWWSLYLIAFGALTFVRNLGVAPLLSGISDWTFLWTLAIIFFGFSMIVPSYPKPWRPGKRWPVGWSGNGKGQASGSKFATWHHTMGETVVGNQPWTLPKKGSVFTGLGESRVNLVTAHLEEGEYALDVSGWMGSIRIVVPRNLPVSVDAGLNMGQVTLFGDSHGGFGRSVRFQDPAFESATTRLRLTAHLNMGDIHIVRVD